MSVAVALLAAAAFGTADFLGGAAGRKVAGIRRAGALTVPVGAQVAGFVAISVAAVGATLVGLATVPTGIPLLVAATAGVGNAVGVSALYRGLAVGRMAVVAPLAAAVTAIVPVTIGFVTGERPSPTVWTGVLLAILAAVAVSRTGAPTQSVGGRQSGWGYGIVAGLGLAAALTLLGHIGTADILWSLATLKAAATGSLLLAALAAGQRVVPPREIAGHVVAVGLLDVAALGAYQWSTTRQLLVIAAVLVSLYPVVTVVLARQVLGERMSRLQTLAVAAAMLGVSLIVVG